MSGSVRSFRRRTYDRLPTALRKPTRSAYDAVHTLRLGVTRGTVRRSAWSVAADSGRPGGAAALRPRARRDVLVVDHRVPEHDVHAGDLTIFHYLRILQESGLRTIYRPHDGLRREPYSTQLESLGIEVLHGDLDMARWFDEHGEALALVLLARPMVAHRLVRVARRGTDAPILYLDHDLHYLRERRRYEETGDPDALSESRRLAEVEAEIFASVDAVLTFSPDEVPEIKRLAPRADVRVVAPAFYRVRAADEEPDAPTTPVTPLDERRGIVFVGAYDHLPNRDAARVLVREVMPLVWPTVPDAHVTLIGGHLVPEIEALAGERVTVAGHVPDLEPLWAQARMSVLPLRFGSGVKGKIIASLEAGVPVVTTPVGNEGIGLRHGVEVLIGTDAQELARHVLAVYRDARRAQDIAASGRRVLRTRFSEDVVRRDLLAALRVPAPVPVA